MPCLLEMRNITRTSGSVKAIDSVSLQLNTGEVVSLCGENGPDESALMKVLCDIYPHGSYEGEVIFAGEEIQVSHIHGTERKGTAIIHQKLALMKELIILEDIFLSSGMTRNGIMDYDLMTLRYQRLLAQVSLSISPDTRVGDLGLGQQQLVEIAKTLNKQARLLVLDEPIASLTEQGTSVLLDITRDLQQHGIACIYISHRLNEVKAVSDTICVIRDGQYIGIRNATEMSKDDIITMMVGRELTAFYPDEPHTTGDEILRIEHLMTWHPVNRHIERVNDVSLSLKHGEILGIIEFVDAGRTGTIRCLFDVWPGQWEGKIHIDGKQIDIRSYQQAITQGIAMIPEDRKRDGIVPVIAVGKNITLAAPNKFTGGISQLDDTAEQKCILGSVQQLKVKTSSLDLAIGRLDGGNQQKAILIRCLLLNLRILILDEPTRGVDIDAKYEIYKLINQLIQQDIAVIVISSELPGVPSLSGRVLVMHEGKLKANLINHNLTQKQVMKATSRNEHHVEKQSV